MDSTIMIVLLFILILATAYFVIAEFAFVKVRTSRIEQLVLEGNKKALNVQKVINNLDGYLSACQLGITVTALGLGWIGEPAVMSVLSPVFERINLGEGVTHTISFLVSFIIVTFLHVVLGELTPKTIAIQKSETITLNLAYSLIVFHKLMYPLIWTLNGSANIIVRLFGMKSVSEHSEAHSEEEIKLIVSSSSDINSDEKSLVERIFKFDETTAIEIMVHRKDMECISINDDMQDVISLVKKSHFTRFPVIGEDKDDVRGYVHIKDLYMNVEKGAGLTGIIREVPHIYEKEPIKKVLKKLQQEKSQIAVIIDEYGGISGLVTMEDIVEEIVGDIQDEYDDETAPIRRNEKLNKWFIEGDTHVEDVEETLNCVFENKEDIVTIGGYFFTRFEEPLKKNAKLNLENMEIEILAIENNTIKLVSIMFVNTK